MYYRINKLIFMKPKLPDLGTATVVTKEGFEGFKVSV